MHTDHNSASIPWFLGVVHCEHGCSTICNLEWTFCLASFKKIIYWLLFFYSPSSSLTFYGLTAYFATAWYFGFFVFKFVYSDSNMLKYIYICIVGKKLHLNKICCFHFKTKIIWYVLAIKWSFHLISYLLIIWYGLRIIDFVLQCLQFAYKEFIRTMIICSL